MSILILVKSSDCRNEIDIMFQTEAAIDERDQTPQTENENNYILFGLFLQFNLTVAKIYKNDQGFRFLEVISKIFFRILIFNVLYVEH